MPEGVGYGPQNTASTGLNLNVIGDHAYAYSGTQGINTSAVTALSFTSGNFYLVGRIYCNGGATAGSTAGSVSGFDILFNGISMGLLRTRTSTDDNPASIYNDIIIPPFTEVQVTVTSGGSDAAILTSVVLSGRVYGKIKE
jgi:hypothetical protein